MDVFAVLLVITAAQCGLVWSGGTGFLFQKQPYPDGSDRVPHVLCGRDHDGTHELPEAIL